LKEDDCKTVHYKTISKNDKKWSFDDKFEDRIFSHVLATDLKWKDGKLLFPAKTIIDTKNLASIMQSWVDEVNIRSALTCETEWWVCKACYWLDLWLNKEIEIWTPVWVIAAQSIWEPWTQLTMRTFHSWWVAKEGWDMTQGLARVEELFEARNPKVLAEISDIDWVVNLEQSSDWLILTVTAKDLKEEEYYFAENLELLVKVWQEVKEKQILAKNTKEKQKVVALHSWIVKKAMWWMIVVKDNKNRVCTYNFDLWKNILVKPGEEVKKWQKMTDWYLSLSKLMNVAGVLAAQQYIVNEIKSIYSSQWQTVNSKHIEIIVRQMFSRVRVLDKWDSSEFFPWDIVDIIKFKKENDKLIRAWKKSSIWERLLLGITKISLYTDSWLSAASFQETVRVLVEWAVSWKIDNLKELKENVIIGRLIPAWRQYRKINNVAIDWDEEEDDDEVYFNYDDESVDLSPAHIDEVMHEMETESDF
jgi:DNA-directed RNA polymerase subunit beta'